ncbi:heme NO-binding domain-containing protein [Tenacibaculum dicentrarchi]|uniref:heme NO-binding domain-containing protein n=1 Tax=Tenacibaculum dicentrarchi TaxID=669041 RepID=UPI001E5213B0|nr:heme NO-binding domain-containing protein [Tenacibaculum dicentrarchi]MCD8407717.1 heme NO-binding domain-containing protein [Tenacibaculum dicentrarchi]MCD8425114.1 heme NO-binding domain-containing protein [Tenacibaculum dicentrarchi]MCD8435031.1 heme NO-binding domain-containing protein [Tenacibaculum dicentrarchi]MCD8442024.1 heme NO-binding domain-containing protein [Tenacibaculum dicentrarchi]
MKGIVFTEFLDLVEEKFGLEVVDKIISQSTLASQGIYTAIGTYSFSEMLQLLQHLSKHSGISIDDLLLLYAEHFFSVIENSYPGLLATYKEPIEMLASIENHIHVEVQKIYPDAELPTFIVKERTKNSLVMIYKSSRAMHHFGLGLMNKTFEHFNTSATIVLEKIKEDGTEVKFIIHKN